MSELLGKMAESLIAGKVDEVTELTKEALDGGSSPQDILEQGLLAGMEVVGKRFKANEMFIPEVLRCAKCMHGAMAILRPLLAETGVKTAGTFVIGTVKGDLHDIGKNLIKMMFDVAGWTVYDLGKDVPLDKFVEEQLRTDSEIVGLSALMTTSMVAMQDIVKKLKEKNPNVRIMLGGAPITQEITDMYGADGYAESAGTAVDEAMKLIKMLKEEEMERK